MIKLQNLILVNLEALDRKESNPPCWHRLRDECEGKKIVIHGVKGIVFKSLCELLPKPLDQKQNVFSTSFSHALRTLLEKGFIRATVISNYKTSSREHVGSVRLKEKS